MSKTRDLCAKARWEAAKKFPFMADGFYAMTFVESELVPTASIDQYWRVYVNPEYAKKCEKSDSLVGLMFHECSHPTRRHRTRRAAINVPVEDLRAWNVFADTEIDTDGQAAGIKIPDAIIAPEGRKHWTAEEHYQDWAKNKSKNKRKIIVCSCSGGSGAGTEIMAWEIGPPDGFNAPGLIEEEADVIRMKIAIATKQYAQSHGRGSVPGGMLRWAEDYDTAPLIDWRMLVVNSVRQGLSQTKGPFASYARPSRRNHPSGLILPVYRQPDIHVGIVIDTSQSMGDSDIGKALGIVVDAVGVLGRVSVVACDAAAGDLVEVRMLEDLKPFLTGGGGTDLRVGIAAALEGEVDALVIVSDGETPWPEKSPEIPVTVVLVRKDVSETVPPWADTIFANV